MLFSFCAITATAGQCTHLTMHVSSSWDTSNQSHVAICNVHFSLNKNRKKVIHSTTEFQHSGSLSLPIILYQVANEKISGMLYKATMSISEVRDVWRC